MKSIKIELAGMSLVGITTRTNNKNEMNSEKAVIPSMLGQYFTQQLGEKVKHRSTPGVTYCAYTEFESDEHGEYTYFVGELVDSLDGQDTDHFATLTVPVSAYQKFTTSPGKMPDVVISAWQEIWAMKKDEFVGARKYQADFEVYDDRAVDPASSVIDIYVGVEG